MGIKPVLPKFLRETQMGGLLGISKQLAEELHSSFPKQVKAVIVEEF